MKFGKVSLAKTQKNPNLGANFYHKLVQISQELGMKPEDILAIMVSESGINATAHEEQFNGGGITGFMPSTLKGLGYEGSPEEFRLLPGEAQLEYTKKYIQNQMGLNGGKGFDNATDYYIANFFPAALKLPGVKAKDPNYAFMELHPETIKGKDGILYSKKYRDVGYNVPAQQESFACKKNPLFHRGDPERITYGDMEQQVEKNRKTAVYLNAIKVMKAQTGYTASQSNVIPVDFSPRSDEKAAYFAKLKKLLQDFMVAASNNPHDYLISIGSSSDKCTSLEYARVLTSAIDDYFDTFSTIHSENNELEVCATINGNSVDISQALKQLTKALANTFTKQTIKIGSPQVFGLVMTDIKPTCPLMHPSNIDQNYLDFKSKFSRKS